MILLLLPHPVEKLMFLWLHRAEMKNRRVFLCVSAGSLTETRCVSCGHVTVRKQSPICAALKGTG